MKALQTVQINITREAVENPNKYAEAVLTAHIGEVKDRETKELEAYFDESESVESHEILDVHKKELNQVLVQVGGVINCLLRLSVTINNPAPYDRFKARGGGQSEFSEPWDIQHVKEKFPHLDAKLAERLGRALTQRRKYFKYREEHHCRLKQGLDTDDDHASTDLATTLASSLPDQLNGSATADLQLNFDVFEDDHSESSATSFATSVLDGSESRVPPIPREYLEGPFLCPFCYVYISVNNRYEWK